MFERDPIEVAAEEGVLYGFAVSEDYEKRRQLLDRRKHTRRALIGLALLAAAVAAIVIFQLKLRLKEIPFVLIGATGIYLLQRYWKKDVDLTLQ
jgi:hypothetical protein